MTKGELAMWEKLTPDDIERARQRLTDRRTEVEQELRGLDDQWREIGVLEQLVGAFARVYMSSPTGSIRPMAPERTAPQLIAAIDDSPCISDSLTLPTIALAPESSERADLALDQAQSAPALAAVNPNSAVAETGRVSDLVVTPLPGGAEHAELRPHVPLPQRAAGD